MLLSPCQGYPQPARVAAVQIGCYSVMSLQSAFIAQ